MTDVNPSLRTGPDLSGRTVLVTGTSSGIGRHFAKILGKSGAQMVLAARRFPLSQDLQAELEADGVRAISVAMEVADESSTIAAYDAAEAGVTQMGRVLASDRAEKGINVNTIAPGYMHTDLTEGLAESRTGQALLAKFPRHRFMDADALDATLLYLCSNASAQVSGSVFTIDDGQTL